MTGNQNIENATFETHENIPEGVKQGIQNGDNQSQANTLSMIDATAPGIREILSSVINISESGMYYEPSCRFCNSHRRIEAEKLIASFDLATRPSDIEEKITKLFASNGETIGSDIIRNHVNTHMNRGDTELKKVEYIARLALLSSNQITTLSQTKLAMATVMECLGSVGAIVPSKGLTAAKAVEMKTNVLNKLIKTWIDLMAMQAKLTGEMWDEGKMIAMSASDFERVFDDALNAAKTPDERKLVANIMDGLQNSTQR